MHHPDVLWPAFAAATLTMLATGLGPLPLLVTGRFPERLTAGGHALAGGMMLAVSFFDLVLPGLETGRTWLLALGFLVGAGLFALGDRLVQRHDWTLEGLTGAGGRRALLILGTMFIHSFPEGVAVGVGYASGETELGAFIALAIAIHNIPEGLAISLPLRAEGVSLPRCVWYSILSSLPQPLAVIPSVLLVAHVQPLLPAGLGFASGAMTFLVMSELVPETLRRGGKTTLAWGFTIGFVLMMLAQYAL